ncbi:transposable element Tcb2 transposase [Trichonephila clavipes]|nr:transposable element Tcb2 transposase [Trichonephila clavipes]
MVNASISSLLYCETLLPHLLRWSHFQRDNARPDTTRVSQGSLCTVTTLPLPTRFPDLSPIEHIWDFLGGRVGHPVSLNELEQCFSNCGVNPSWGE